ncbi:DsbA family protein [Mobilicoccus caccae]|uniref:Membrane protein n=1 Tax=Mobilicoccus caccae TaxID=1859295 RepID=A0ABQ6IPR5_9MICO|nr:thioredoxin domain-containing protein [Mobilicoccus caccae]GMA39441.1 membrane protein [Mobilicoccus caccae]
MSTSSNDRSARQAKIKAAAPKESNLKPVLATIIAVLAIAGIAAAIVFGMQDRGGDDAQAAGVPRGAQSANGGILLNATDPGQGVPVVDVYEDFQCHWCKTFHEILGPKLDELATSGEAKVVIHMKNFLDQGESGESTRIANAAACAADVSPQAFMKTRDALMNAQPEQGQPGWTEETMKKIADDAGITGDARQTYDKCVSDVKYKSYIAAVDEQSARDGVTATPSYKINGQPFDLGQVLDQNTGATNPEAFTQAVEAAKKN